MINYLIIERLSIITPNNKMRHTLKTLLLLFSAAITISMALLSCDSYERKMARFEKVADEFKATLGPNDKIITERIDSIAQKIFYSKYTEDELGSTVIMVHDYSNGETKQVLPNAHSIEDYEMCDDIWFRAYKVVNDRLFLLVYSPCMRHREATGVFYVNFRDNTLHFVEFCYEASFLDNSSITINRHYLLGIEDGLEQTKEEQYTLSTSLSDEAYADNRWEQKRKEERLANEWRKHEEEKRLEEERRRQGVERIIKIDYSLILNRAGYEDYAGSLQGLTLYRDGVYTKAICVPKGKVWQLKNISYSGYPGPNPPRFYYSRSVNGDTKELENGQILCPNLIGYVFWIMFDEKRNESGRRTAKIVFLEKEY